MKNLAKYSVYFGEQRVALTRAERRGPNRLERLPVSVIVPHYNCLDGLKLCLESLERQSLRRDHYEIIVVDNGTPGGLGPLPGAFERVRFLHADERGAACARNAGLKVARGEAIAFIDADCIAHKDWLAEGLASLWDADLAGGRVEVTSREADAPTDVEAFERVFAFRQRTYVKRRKFSATANLFARREAAKAIGAFRNGVSEDVDWCRRGVALGFRLAFNDKAVVSHPARYDWSDLSQKWERMIRERWNGFGAQNPFRRAVWLGLAMATALSAAPHLISVLTSSQLSSLRDRIGAMKVLTRIRFWRAQRMVALLAAR